MLLRDILVVKGTAVHTIGPDASLDDVLTKLVQLNIGSLVVCECGTDLVIGIVTERDILRAQAAHGAPLEQLNVRQSMSGHLITARPDDTIAQAMGLMTHHRVRHLPIVNEGRIVGMISIGDVVKAEHDEVVTENYFLRTYIQGGSAEVLTI